MADIHIGTAGWSYKDWKGTFYPADMPSKADRLEYLSRYFDLVELNGTFYRPPEPEHAEKWLKSVEGNPNFNFTAKLYRKFTHEDRDWTDADVRQFARGIAPLHEAGALGGLLVQFSWGFQNTQENRGYLKRLADTFAEYPRVLEVRHVSWDNDASYDFMRTNGYNFCTIDQPASRGSVSSDARSTGDIGYIRLHGRNSSAWFNRDAGRDDKYNYLYTPQEIEEWIAKAKMLAAQCKRLFIVANNHFKAQAAANAMQIAAALLKKTITIPEPLVATYPFLKSDI